jgi:hypothetical protein
VTQDNRIFDQYKPLRNHIRKLSLADSLAVIRAYVENLQFGTPIPADCEVDSQYAGGDRLEKVKLIAEFHLETLCREIILHAVDSAQCPETLRNWKTLARAINKLKHLEEFIGNRFLTPEMLMLELHRTAHRQFPWQMSRPIAPNIMRYFLIYKHSPMAGVIQEIVGLTVEELFLTGMALLGTFTSNFALFRPVNIQIPGLSSDTFSRFLRHFSIGLAALRDKLKEEQEMNDKFAYAFHSLRAYPIIQMTYRSKESLVCPLPTLLFWRFTSGVYYEVLRHKGFDNAFGEAFQAYIGKVLMRGADPSRTRVLPEEEYRVRKELKRTVDWIVEQDDSAMFIEAKTKRMVMEARVEIITQATLLAELGKMAEIIVQVYRSIREYREGRYPNYPFKAERQIFPVIVTLEDWFLMGPKLLGELDSKIKASLVNQGMPESWIIEMPYTVCSAHELEDAVQIIDRAGIRNVLGNKVFDTAKREWALDPYLRDNFRDLSDQSKFLFEEEYDALDVEALTKQPDADS